jgi:hypothetical protein
MTEPDEALIWAREDWAKATKGVGGPFQKIDAAEIRAGKKDVWGDVTVRAQAYRAGQAASAERIKALEEALRPYAFPNGSDTPLGDEFNRNRARALLKEADQ